MDSENNKQQQQQQTDHDRYVAAQLAYQLEKIDHLNELERDRQDELMARAMQEREQLRFERYKEKSREKELQRERRRISRAARLAASLSSSKTPQEDRGDFTDFYKLPDAVEEREQVREQQDEEIALLLQNEEMRRRSALLNNPALESAVELDARLANIIAEQERLRLRRYERRIEEKESKLRLQIPTKSIGIPAVSPVGFGSSLYDNLYSNVASSSAISSPIAAVSSITASVKTQAKHFPLSGSERQGYNSTGSDRLMVNQEAQKIIGSAATANEIPLHQRRAGSRDSLLEAVTGGVNFGAEMVARNEGMKLSKISSQLNLLQFQTGKGQKENLSSVALYPQPSEQLVEPHRRYGPYLKHPPPEQHSSSQQQQFTHLPTERALPRNQHFQKVPLTYDLESRSREQLDGVVYATQNIKANATSQPLKLQQEISQTQFSDADSRLWQQQLRQASQISALSRSREQPSLHKFTRAEISDKDAPPDIHFEHRKEQLRQVSQISSLSPSREQPSLHKFTRAEISDKDAPPDMHFEHRKEQLRQVSQKDSVDIRHPFREKPFQNPLRRSEYLETQLHQPHQSEFLESTSSELKGNQALLPTSKSQEQASVKESFTKQTHMTHSKSLCDLNLPMNSADLKVRQPGPYAEPNSTLFRPANPFTRPDTATTPLGPTYNIAAALDPTYNKSTYVGVQRRIHDVNAQVYNGALQGDRRRSTGPENVKNKDCKVQ